MATIVHRRPAPLRERVPVEAPASRLDSFGWLEWASAVAAFGFLVFGLRPLMDLGGPGAWNWELVGNTVVDPLRDVAIVAMPAALGLGVTGARHRVPWLFRGTVLLALEQVLKPVQDWLFEQYITLVPEAMSVGYDTLPGLALIVFTLGVGVLGIAGAWALGDGLADAGARPRRLVLLPVVLVVTGLAMAAYLPMAGFFADPPAIRLDTVLGWISVASLVIAFVDIAVWTMMAVRLVAGLASGLAPRPAWALGALAGVLLIAVQVGAPVLTAWLTDLPAIVGQALAFSSRAGAIALTLALLAGLGRGRAVRGGRRRLLRLYVLHPAA